MVHILRAFQALITRVDTALIVLEIWVDIECDRYRSYLVKRDKKIIFALCEVD